MYCFSSTFVNPSVTLFFFSLHLHISINTYESLSLSLSLNWSQIMMTFCKRSVHSFLGLSSINNIPDHKMDQKLPLKCYGGLEGLVTATGDIHRPPKVVESSSVKPSSSSSSSSSSLQSKKVKPREIGFFNDENVEGLMSCTESLGFESSDERRVDGLHHNNSIDEIELLCPKTTSSSSSSSSSSSLPSSWRLNWRRRRLERKREEEKKFPPPLSTLYHNGQPSFFLRPVRKDGRLELTEVRIDRPSVFHAYREDGRLRLHFVRDDIHDEDDDDEEHEEEVEEVVEEVGEERVVGGGEFRFKGFGRCHQTRHSHHNDYHQHHHHHNLLGEVS